MVIFFLTITLNFNRTVQNGFEDDKQIRHSYFIISIILDIFNSHYMQNRFQDDKQGMVILFLLLYW